MKIQVSDRLNSLGSYAFAEVDKKVKELKDQGVSVIAFGVGDPLDPTPELIREACKSGVDKRQSAGYPSYVGTKEYLEAIAGWVNRTYDIKLNPETEITSTIGSKEAVYHFPTAILNDRDYVICPTPGYPPYKTGTIMAGGVPYYVPLLAENDFLIDYQSIPQEICDKAKIIWINYPNSPTGALASREWYEGLIAWAKKNEIIIAADDGCYDAIYFDKKPLSILEVSQEGIIVFSSLSKRSNMTCYRVGWVMGDPELIAVFKKLKTNIDSGTPTFIQDAAITALEDETHVEKIRDDYRVKRDIMLEALSEIGLETKESDATFYLWQKVPEGMTSLEFATKLLDPNIAIVVTPGSWISDETEDGVNPGEGYVRFALVPTVELVKEAAARLKANYR